MWWWIIGVSVAAVLLAFFIGRVLAISRRDDRDDFP
jgi:hypothetical protein